MKNSLTNRIEKALKAMNEKLRNMPIVFCPDERRRHNSRSCVPDSTKKK